MQIVINTWNHYILKNNNFFKIILINRCKSKMSQKPNRIKPPECVRGMTVLDKSKFTSRVIVPVLHVSSVQISKVLANLKKYCFKMRHLKPLQCCDNDNTILLNPALVSNWCDIGAADREALEQLSLTSENLRSSNISIQYDNYYANEILSAVLPEDQEGFSSFSQIGHIIHLNLREHLLPYKKLIAQVLLDKIPNTRTVINKVDMIDNTFRYFEKELLCGEDDMMVQIRENKCQFEFDFSKIYWNPRLSTEHERIVNILKPNEVLFDVFAGVGPFSIPAAKKRCIVFANDLNPDSYKWLNHNLRKNKIDTNFLKTYNKDGRDFILNDIKTELVKYVKTHTINIVMNLPALAVEFLTSFVKMYKAEEIDIINPPMVHVYCFTKGEDCVDIAKNLVFKNIGFDISDKIVNIFKVRTVSSLKEMMRVSFKLDKDILVGQEDKKRKYDNCIADTNKCTKKSHNGKEQSKTDEEGE